MHPPEKFAISVEAGADADAQWVSLDAAAASVDTHVSQNVFGTIILAARNAPFGAGEDFRLILPSGAVSFRKISRKILRINLADAPKIKEMYYQNTPPRSADRLNNRELAAALGVSYISNDSFIGVWNQIEKAAREGKPYSVGGRPLDVTWHTKGPRMKYATVHESDVDALRAVVQSYTPMKAADIPDGFMTKTGLARRLLVSRLVHTPFWQAWQSMLTQTGAMDEVLVNMQGHSFLVRLIGGKALVHEDAVKPFMEALKREPEKNRTHELPATRSLSLQHQPGRDWMDLFMIARRVGVRVSDSRLLDLWNGMLRAKLTGADTQINGETVLSTLSKRDKNLAIDASALVHVARYLDVPLCEKLDEQWISMKDVILHNGAQRGVTVAEASTRLKNFERMARMAIKVPDPVVKMPNGIRVELRLPAGGAPPVLCVHQDSFVAFTEMLALRPRAVTANHEFDPDPAEPSTMRMK